MIRKQKVIGLRKRKKGVKKEKVDGEETYMVEEIVDDFHQ